MTDAVLRRLARLAERARAARRARDEAIREARAKYGPTAIGKAVGLSRSRIVQIVREQEKEDGHE